MKTTKRLLAMLLVLAMLLSNLPAAALAEEFAELVSEEPASDVIVPEETEAQPEETEAPETDPPETTEAEETETSAEATEQTDGEEAPTEPVICEPMTMPAANSSGLPTFGFYSSESPSLANQIVELVAEDERENVFWFGFNPYGDKLENGGYLEPIVGSLTVSAPEFVDIEMIDAELYRMTLTEAGVAAAAEGEVTFTVWYSSIVHWFNTTTNAWETSETTGAGQIVLTHEVHFTTNNNQNLPHLGYYWLTTTEDNVWYESRNLGWVDHINMIPKYPFHLAFYAAKWDEEAEDWTYTPVHHSDLEYNSNYLSIETLTEPKEGPYSEYYAVVTPNNETAWNTSSYIRYTDEEGVTYSLDCWLGQSAGEFYLSPDYSDATVDTRFTVDPNAEENAFWWYFNTSGGVWELLDIEIVNNADRVIVEELDGMYEWKLTLTEDAVENAAAYGWYDISLNMTAYHTIEERNYYWYAAMYVNPPAEDGEVPEPYLTYGWLNEEGEGWYEDGDHVGEGYNIMPGREAYHIYYLNEWNYDLGDYAARPVHVQADGDLNLELVGGEYAAPGQENGDYFYRITTDTWDQEIPLYTVLDDGTCVYGVHVSTYREPVWTYSSMDAGIDTIVVHDFIVDLSDGADNELYVALTDEYWSVDGDFWVEDWCTKWIWLEETEDANIRRVRLTDEAIRLLSYGEFLWIGIGVNTVSGDDCGTFYTNIGLIPDFDTIPHMPFLTVGWLEDWGDGLREPEYHDHDGMGPLPGDIIHAIFYLHEWNEDDQCYYDRPVYVRAGEGGIHLDNVNGPIAEGQDNADYFYEITVDNWDEAVEVYYVMDDGTRVSFWGWTGRPDVGFYTSPEMSNETWCGHRPFEIDPFGTNTVYFGLNSDWATVQDLWTHDWAYEYVDIERINEYVYSITLTEAGINQNMGQYLLGIPICLDIVDNNDPDHVEYRETNIDFSRMGLETLGFFQIDYETYEIIDGGYIHGWPTGEFDEWGQIWMHEVTDHLPDGASYDLDSNTLTLDNFHGESLVFGYRYFDKERGEYNYDLSSDTLTIELIGENSLVSDEDIALNIRDELSVEFVGDGSLYILAVNHVENTHEDGTPRHYPAANFDGDDIIFRDNVTVTVEIAGDGMESCWDENGYMGDRPAHLVAINIPGEKGIDMCLYGNATLTTVIPEGARGNGPTLDWEDPYVFWGDRRPGGYSGMHGFDHLNIYGGTVNTQTLGTAWGYDEDGNLDPSHINLYSGELNIDSMGFHVTRGIENENGEMEPHEGYYYTGLEIGPDCSVNVYGGAVNVDVTPNDADELYGYCGVSNMGGRLNIFGGEVNINASGEGLMMGLESFFGENGELICGSSLKMTDGVLNLNNPDFCAFELFNGSEMNLLGGVINAENADFRLGGEVTLDGGRINANNSILSIDNTFVMESGEINMLEGYNCLDVNGMAEMNGGSINLHMTDFYVNNGFHFNGGEINIENTEEIEHAWSAMTVNTYFAISGDAQLNIVNALQEPAVQIIGTFHQMGGTVNIDHRTEWVMAVYVAAFENDEGELIYGTMLLNEGDFNVYMPREIRDYGVWVDEHAVLFMGAQPEEEGGQVRPDQIPMLNLENAALMLCGVADLQTNAVLNVVNGLVELGGRAELIMNFNAEFTVTDSRDPDTLNPDIWTCVFHTSDDASIILRDDSVLNIQAEYYNSAAIINGRFLQDGGTVNISNVDEGNYIEGEGCFHINGNGKVIICDGEMNLSGTDTAIGLDTYVDRDDGATLTISGGNINIDVDRLAMFLTASTLITGGNFDIDVTGYDEDLGSAGDLLYAQGIYIDGWDNPDAKLTITGGNFDIRVEKDAEDYEIRQVNGIYVLQASADITGGVFHLDGAEVILNSSDPQDYLNMGLAAYSLSSGNLLQLLEYTVMFDGEGNPTKDPAAAAMIRYCEAYEEDNIPGDLATDEGVEFVRKLVLISDKAGGNVTWKAENGVLKFVGVGGMYDYAPAAPAPWVVLSDFIKTVEMDSNLKKIGSYAFNGLKKLTTLDFLGNPPEFAENALYGVVADAFHLIGNENWTADKMKNYGGNITWIQHYGHEAVTGLETDKDMLLAGQTATLTATVIPAQDPDLKVIWELAEGDKNFVTLKVNADHTATITAKKNAQYRDVTVTAYVEGSAAEPMFLKIAVLPVVTKVGIFDEDGKDITGKTVTLYMGITDGMQLEAVNDPAGSYQNVTWKSSNDAQVTVDENGYVTALVAGKTVTITATANDGSGKKATVKIKTMIPVEMIEVSGSEVCAAGKTITLTAAVSPADAGNKKLAWEIVYGHEYATISNGKLKAVSKVDGQEIVVVRVSSVENPEVYELYTVTIYPATTEVVIKADDQYVTGKTVDFTMSSDAQENVLQLIAESNPEEAAQQWTWKSSSDAIATVDEDGQVTLLQAGKTVTITVTASDGTGKKATVKIKTVQPMEDITLSGPAVAAAGKSVTLTANIYPANTTNQKLVWSVEGEGATVSGGKLKVDKTIEDGAVVTVRAAWAENPEEVYNEWDVTLYQTAASKVEIQDADGKVLSGTVVLDMDTENPLDLYAQVQTDAAAQDVIWTSSNAAQAAVSEDGVVTVLVPGKVVTITAAAADGSGKKATLKVKGNQLMKELNLREDLVLDAYSNLIIAGGKSLKLASAVEILPATTSNQKLEWSVECEDPNVKISAATGALSTKVVSELVVATVTAKALDGSETELSFDVSIYPATTKVTVWNGGSDVTGKTLTAPSGALVPLVGQSEPGNTADLYTWTSSSDALATVDEDGMVTLTGAVGKTVTITCTAADGTGKKATVKIKIVEAS